MTLDVTEHAAHLDLCLQLAEQALEAGDYPFGSVLVDASGAVLQTAMNQENSASDATAHPEFELARWAAHHVPAEERGGCTVYTSGEHCAMCSAAHAWVGLGNIVYAASARQLADWRAGWGLPASPVAVLPVSAVATDVVTIGPVSPYDERIRELHLRGIQARAAENAEADSPA